MSGLESLDVGDLELLPCPSWVPSEMTLMGTAARNLRYPMYGIRMVQYVSKLLPAAGPCTILDVGAGRGELASMLGEYRPDTEVLALETFIRPDHLSDVRFTRFDGSHIPLGNASVDVSLLMNVLHHATLPLALLLEVRRVTRRRIIVKDHLAGSILDHIKLTTLDILGNAGSGAVVRGRYLSRRGWERLLGNLPSVKVALHEGLEFRRGILAGLFPNRLEVLIEIDVENE